MKTIIGVMGPGAGRATAKDLEAAYDIGRLVAETDSVLLTGGMRGVMAESARGAQEVGGLTLGLGPTMDKQDLNQYIDIPVMTGMHSGRNFLNILSADLVIFVTVGSAGTLSELAYAIQLERPSLVLGGSEKLRAYMAEL